MSDLPRLNPEQTIEPAECWVSIVGRKILNERLERRERCHKGSHHNDRYDQLHVAAAVDHAQSGQGRFHRMLFPRSAELDEPYSESNETGDTGWNEPQAVINEPWNLVGDPEVVGHEQHCDALHDDEQREAFRPIYADARTCTFRPRANLSACVCRHQNTPGTSLAVTRPANSR